MGNEKAINQLIAHHSVIFKPEDRLMWVSTEPFQLGKYICYDLKKIFSEADSLDPIAEIAVDSLAIQPDNFLFSDQFRNFNEFKRIRSKLKKDNSSISESELADFISLNPEYYLAYELAGDYFAAQGNNNKSADFYNFALSKEISSATERRSIIKKISKLNGDSRNREKK